MNAAGASLRRLGDVARVRKGTTITEKQATPGPFPVIAGGTKPAYYHDVSNRAPNVATISASGYAGYVSYWRVPIWASDCITVEPLDADSAEPSYLFHALKYIEPTVLQAMQRGAAQKHVYAKDVQEVEIFLPPIEEQRRIASILEAADTLRTKRRLALTKLDILTQAIFVDMFGDPLLRHDYDMRPLSAVATVVTGNTPSRSESANFGSDIEWVKSDNIQNSGVVTKAMESLSPQGKQRGRLAPQGACLVVCIAGSPESIGRVGLLDRSVTFNQQINAVVPGPNLLPEFLLGQLRASKKLIQRASTNSMKGMVSKSALSDLNVHVPPLSEQAEFSARAQSCRESVRRVQSSLDQIDALFASLQHRAFRGEL